MGVPFYAQNEEVILRCVEIGIQNLFWNWIHCQYDKSNQIQTKMSLIQVVEHRFLAIYLLVDTFVETLLSTTSACIHVLLIVNESEVSKSNVLFKIISQGCWDACMFVCLYICIYYYCSRRNRENENNIRLKSAI